MELSSCTSITRKDAPDGCQSCLPCEALSYHLSILLSRCQDFGCLVCMWRLTTPIHSCPTEDTRQVQTPQPQGFSCLEEWKRGDNQNSISDLGFLLAMPSVGRPLVICRLYLQRSFNLPRGERIHRNCLHQKSLVCHQTDSAVFCPPLRLGSLWWIQCKTLSE